MESTSTNPWGQTPLHIAAAKGDLSNLEKLLAKATAQQLALTDLNGRNCLHMAVASHRLSAVKKILSYAPQLANRKDFQGETPLHAAAQAEESLILQELLSTFSTHSPLPSNAQQQTLLHLAAWKGGISTLRSLLILENVSTLWKKDCLGRTPLHLAAAHGRLQQIQILLESFSHSRLIDGQDHLNRTPLHCAVSSGHLPCAQLLSSPPTTPCTPWFSLDYQKRSLFHYAVLAESPALIIHVLQLASSLPREQKVLWQGIERSLQLHPMLHIAQKGCPHLLRACLDAHPSWQFHRSFLSIHPKRRLCPFELFQEKQLILIATHPQVPLPYQVLAKTYAGWKRNDHERVHLLWKNQLQQSPHSLLSLALENTAITGWLEQTFPEALKEYLKKHWLQHPSSLLMTVITLLPAEALSLTLSKLSLAQQDTWLTLPVSPTPGKTLTAKQLLIHLASHTPPTLSPSTVAAHKQLTALIPEQSLAVATLDKKTLCHLQRLLPFFTFRQSTLVQKLLLSPPSSLPSSAPQSPPSPFRSPPSGFMGGLGSHSMWRVALEEEGLTPSSTHWKLYLPDAFHQVDDLLRSLTCSHPQQIIGAISGSLVLAQKESLWSALCSFFGERGAQQIMPPTCLLQSPKQVERFLHTHGDSATYVMKKNLQKNQGISFTKSKKKVLQGRKEGYTLVQTYLPSQLTIHKRYTTLRAFVCLLTQKTRTQGFLHAQMLCHYTAQDLTPHSLDPKTLATGTHLYTPSLHENRPLTLYDLHSFCAQNQIHLESTLNQIHTQVRSVLQSTHHLLHTLPNTFHHRSFQLFGVDLALCLEGKVLSPRILEWNNYPSALPISERFAEIRREICLDTLRLAMGKSSSNPESPFRGFRKFFDSSLEAHV